MICVHFGFEKGYKMNEVHSSTTVVSPPGVYNFIASNCCLDIHAAIATYFDQPRTHTYHFFIFNDTKCPIYPEDTPATLLMSWKEIHTSSDKMASEIHAIMRPTGYFKDPIYCEYVPKFPVHGTYYIPPQD